MMEILKSFLFVTFFLFCSCSRIKFQKKIEDPLKDSLRHESLARQNKMRLSPFIINDSPKKYISHCHLNSFEKGIHGLRMSFDKRKEEPELWNELGLCFFLRGENSKAYYYFNVSLEKTSLNKTFKSRAYNNLGLLFIEWENYPKAIESFEKSLQIQPEARVPRYNLALIFLKLGHPKKALGFLDKIPGGLEDDDFFISRGFAALLNKRYKKSLKEFEKVSKFKKKRHDVGLYKTYAFFKLGQIKKAKKNLEKKINSNNRTLIIFEKELQKQILELDKEDKNEIK